MDELEIDELLEEWARADADDPRLPTNRILVQSRKRRQQEDHQYDAVYQIVKADWDDAETLIKNDSRVAAGTLVQIYTRAYEYAREQASNYPDHARLQQLLADASQRRGNIGKEAEKMLSGANIEKIIETLEYLDSLTDSDMPMVYSLAGQAVGRRSRIEARREVEQQARQLAKEKITTYIGDARDALASQNPRTAQAILAEWNKFKSLETLVTNLLPTDTIGNFSQARKAIQDSVDQLEQAEKMVQDASKVADSDPRSAVKAYASALSMYTGAARSSVVQEARDQIQSILEATLDRHIQELQTSLKGFETDRVEADATTLTQQYGDIGKVGFILAGRLERIEALRQEATSLRQDIENVAKQLTIIEKTSVDNPTKAKTDLEQLERNAKPTILKANSKYEVVKNQVGARADASGEIDRLSAFLEQNSVRMVTSALASAKRSMEESTTHKGEFEELAVNLEARLLYLEADDLVGQSGYDKVIGMLEATLRNTQLQVRLRRLIEEKRDQLHTESEEIGSVKNMLDQAERLIPTDPRQSVKILKGVVNFPSAAERTRHRNLLQRAEEASRNELRTFFRGLAINAIVDTDLLDQKLEEYEEVDYTAADRERTRTQVYRNAQLAVRSEELGELETAIATWENLMNRVKPDDIHYVKNQITRLQHELSNRAVRNLLERVNQLDSQDSNAFQEWERELIEQITSSQRLFDAATNQEKLAIGQRLLKMYVERGLRLTDKQMRQGVFDKAQSVGVGMDTVLKRITNLTKTDPLVLESNQWIETAKILPQVGGLLNEFERYVQPNAEFRQFRKAITDWVTIFLPYASMLPTVEAWARQRADTTRTDLYAKINSTPATERSGVNTLSDYAKLLALDPQDAVGNRLWYTLRQIGDEQSRDITNLRNDIFGDAQSGHPNPLDLLTEQLNNLEIRKQSLMLIIELATNFSEMQHELVGDAITLRNDAEKLLQDRLEPMLRDLRLFETATREYSGFLRGYELSDDGRDGWKGYQKDFDTYWHTFQQRIGEIKTDGQATLDKHPLCQKLSNDRGVLNTRLNTLVNALKKIQEACDKEYFEEAYTALGNIDDGFFSNHALADSFVVRDVWQNRSVEGWEEVKTLINERYRAFSRLAQWAEPFGAPVRIGETLPLTDTPPPAPNIVAWESVMNEATNSLGLGNFDEAREWIKGAQSGGYTDYPYPGLTLQEALEILSKQIPMAIDADLYTDSYHTARAKAGSKRGESLLTWIENKRAKILEEQSRAATEQLEKIDRAEKRVKESEEGFYAALKTVQNELDKPFYTRSRQNIRASMDTANGHLRNIETNTSKRNPLLEKLKTTPTYNEGSKVLQ